GIVRSQQRSEPIDARILASDLQSDPRFNGNAGAVLLELMQGVSTAVHIDLYVGRVLEAARKRSLYCIAEAAREGSLNGQSADAVYNALRSDLDDFARDVASGKPKYRAITAAELATATYDLTYLIERILVLRQPCILGGPKKALKTSK